MPTNLPVFILMILVPHTQRSVHRGCLGPLSETQKRGIGRDIPFVPLSYRKPVTGTTDGFRVLLCLCCVALESNKTRERSATTHERQHAWAVLSRSLWVVCCVRLLFQLVRARVLCVLALALLRAVAPECNRVRTSVAGKHLWSRSRSSNCLHALHAGTSFLLSCASVVCTHPSI